MISLTANKMIRLFPFGFVLDQDLNFVIKGKSLVKILSVQDSFSRNFEITRPRGSLEPGFAAIAKHAGKTFTLRTRKQDPELILSGTFVVDSAHSLIFMGYPNFGSLQALHDCKLIRSDFGPLNPLADLMDAFEKKEAAHNDLKKRNEQLTGRFSALESRDSELNNFFNLSLDFMCLANTDGFFVKINQTFCSVLGYSEKELLSNKFLTYVHPDDLKATINEIAHLSQGYKTISFENRYRKSDGTYIVLNWNCIPDASKGLLYATARDMTEHNMMIQHEKELILERQGTELIQRMLDKVLPPAIVSRMQRGDDEIADYYPQVSILFADIVDFSSIVKLMPAMVVRKFLTLVFEHFDSIIVKHGCEKIKSIGDGYLAIAGAPVACEDHSERLTAAALEMIRPFELPEELGEYFAQGASLSFRIGMHVGAIVGGVLGNCRPLSYDIWGDAVNVASRMQSTGEPNKIHVTADFVMHLKNRYVRSKADMNFRFEKRGNIEVKHMGKIFTYYINGDLTPRKEAIAHRLQPAKIAAVSARRTM
jgi:PAS domain S-box-containing protein